jgi:hypothetical protein
LGKVDLEGWDPTHTLELEVLESGSLEDLIEKGQCFFCKAGKQRTMRTF